MNDDETNDDPLLIVTFTTRRSLSENHLIPTVSIAKALDSDL